MNFDSIDEDLMLIKKISKYIEQNMQIFDVIFDVFINRILLFD
jgi:hypothetical protein